MAPQPLPRVIALRLALFLLFCASLALSAAAAQAGSVFPAHRCDGCAGSSRMEGVAIAAGAGQRYVFSVASGEIRKFQVAAPCGPDPQGAGRTPRRDAPAGCREGSDAITVLPVEPGVQDLMRRISDAWVWYGGSLHAHETVSHGELAPSLGDRHAQPREDDPSAYDFVQDSPTRNRVLAAIDRRLEQGTHSRTVRSLLREVVAIDGHGAGLRMGLAAEASVRTRIVFSDGSWARVRVAPGNPDRVEYEMGTAVDANGASLPDPSYRPDTGTSPGGGYLAGSHDPQDRQRWCELATMAGIACSTGGGPGRIVCRRVNDGPLRCTGH